MKEIEGRKISGRDILVLMQRRTAECGAPNSMAGQ